MVIVVVGGTLVFWLTGTYRNPLLALYHVLNLITLNAGPNDLENRSGLLQILALGVTTGGLLALAGGAASIIELLNDPRERNLALASTFTDHIIVCGVGRIGSRVINELLEFGERVVAVNSTEKEEWLDNFRLAGVAVIVGDARRRRTLLDAGVARASAVVICTRDDLVNLDIALDARELNPQIKVVLQMFDAKLAENVSKGFNIKTAFSVSALAAPAFAAAATRAKVKYSFKLKEQLLNVSEVTFSTRSPFTGKSIGQLEDEANCSVIALDTGAGLQTRVFGDCIMRAGDTAYVVGDLAAIRMLHDGQ